jgi:hypothetical protein
VLPVESLREWLRKRAERVPAEVDRAVQEILSELDNH